MSGPISDHIRSNVWAIAACLIAVMGTAVVASASEEGPQTAKSAAPAKQVKKLKKQLRSVEARLAALEASQGAARAPTGPAGGELAGTYPNPTIGTVSGLDLASSATAAGGIQFGPDTNLYRQAPDFLSTDDSFRVGSFLQVTGDAQIGNGPEDELSVFGYLRLPFIGTAGAPSTDDCNSNLEVGRTVFNTADERLYICDFPLAWRSILAS